MSSPDEVDEQQLHLRWNNHSSTVMEVLNEQFSRQDLVDVTLSCQGSHFRAHRVVLSACSPYFQDIFNNHNTPHPIVILNNMSSAHVKALLDFMYKGEIRVVQTELEGFLQIAEALQVKGLCNIRTRIVLKRQKSEQRDDEPKSKQAKCESSEESAEEASPPPLVTKTSKVPPAVHAAHSPDTDLASMIKVEPPDITDIDACSPQDKEEEPRVIVDLPVVSEKVTTITTTTFRPLKGRPKRGEMSEESVAGAGKIRRPPNAFMVFANEWRRKLAVENPSESNKDISIRLGVMWKSLSAGDKQSYYNAAKKADIEHKQKYPNYYYSPKEAREALLRKKLTKKKPCFEATQLVRVLMPVGDDDQDELDS
ncbi:transcription factor SOX-30-like [Neocloeon triangulifer]|uniref:transcription factor SOX-30-like n=1 Tax=Neocloeon triangulifer TaxID=2078957 RepID=UPI00286EC036|nr:transcription factor SOX-30-like [Neocloeon triangulifer]